MNIRPVSPAIVKTMAVSAAHSHIPLKEANFYERGSDLWHTFNDAYRAAEIAAHDKRRDAASGVFA